jgi:hypothetical protein
MPHTRWIKRWLATAGVLAVVLSLAAACGDDNGDDGGGSGSGSGSSSEEDACAQAEDLRNSIGDLSDVNVAEEGSSALDDAVDNIEQQADDLASTVSDDLQPEVDDVKSSLSDLKDAVANVDQEGGVSAVVDAVQAVLTTSDALIEKVTSADC